jgi:hypothetical protein
MILDSAEHRADTGGLGAIIGVSGTSGDECLNGKRSRDGPSSSAAAPDAEVSAT